MPFAAPQREDGLADGGERRAPARLDHFERARQLGVAQRAGALPALELEGDGEHDPAGGRALEGARAVREAARGRRDRLDDARASGRGRAPRRSSRRPPARTRRRSGSGVAPAEPGMPDRHSTPASPSATQPRRTASHGSPACDLEAQRSPPSSSRRTPRVRHAHDRAGEAVVGARRRSSRPRARAAARRPASRREHGLDDRVLGRGLEQAPGGPPRRSVVSSLNGVDTGLRRVRRTGGELREACRGRRCRACPCPAPGSARGIACAAVARAPRPRLAVAARLARSSASSASR